MTLMKGNKKNNKIASPRQIIKLYTFLRIIHFFLDLPTKY